MLSDELEAFRYALPPRTIRVQATVAEHVPALLGEAGQCRQELIVKAPCAGLSGIVPPAAAATTTTDCRPVRRYEPMACR